jgi:hypothetical protein
MEGGLLEGRREFVGEGELVENGDRESRERHGATGGDRSRG